MTDMKRETDRPMPDVVGILPLRGTVLFPQAVVPLGAGRVSSLRLIEEAVQGGRLVGAVTQKDPKDDAPGADGLHSVGTLTVIHKALKQPDGSLRLIAQGVGRFRLVEIVQTEPYLKARIEPIEEQSPAQDLELEALVRSVTSLFAKVVSLSPTLPDELVAVLDNVEGPGAVADLIAASFPVLPLALKQELLETVNVRERLSKLAAALGKEAEVLELGSKIQSEIQSEMSKTQRDYYLREQMKAIQKELGEGDERTQEVDALRAKIEAAGMPAEAKSEALRELDRLAKMPPAAAEYTVARTYIDWLVAMPWQQETTDAVEIGPARVILDEDHEGLEKVKDRILEYLAVKKIRPGGKDPILCFVGPPGVGKTSLGKSIARALGRKFHRISLGGMRDEAEIRGHRRTYIGALPGQIVQGLRRAGTKNPVLMLDEVDKLGMDFRGDPASALLEVLDPEQNATFRDHYLDVPFDLSRVLFITTANVIDTVPAPLRDRMELINLAGYTEEEKVAIAQRHLVPKQACEHGLASGTDIVFEPESLRLLARGYTREAGVRSLEREIASVCRKVARRRAEGNTEPVRVAPDVVVSYLGVPRFELEEVEQRTRVPGVATGLAWTPAGGDVLFVEATRMRGAHTLTLTGQLGDVMKESVQAALSWVRSHAGELGIDAEFWEHSDVHVHVPAGAIPKDGPSAGVTMATALVSLLTARPVRPDLAMTGEISLSGRVLPVGGIKEKVLAAHRAGIRTIVLPRRNEKNLLEDVPAAVRQSLSVHLADTIGDVLAVALEHSPAAAREVLSGR
ncbi:MAG: endopeptidase La [Candidatus Rokuibacteriota bacterium]|nr:MAG: endopeptidase La [Candidatus Rokubacteria bacterium]